MVPAVVRRTQKASSESQGETAVPYWAVRERQEESLHFLLAALAHLALGQQQVAQGRAAAEG